LYFRFGIVDITTPDRVTTTHVGEQQPAIAPDRVNTSQKRAQKPASVSDITLRVGTTPGQREDRGATVQYTSKVPSFMGATVHKLIRKYQPMSECPSSL
jgi:hypothetical protein